MARAAVWGLGRFGGGLAAALHLHRLGYEIRIIDRSDPEELATPLAEIQRVTGAPSPVLPESPASFDGVALVVLNPGIAPSHPLLTELATRGIERTQELDLFLEAYPGRVVAVTGTNGKSTTATMIAAILAAHEGHEDAVLLGGNIGRSLLLDRERWREDQWAVVEVSSFQAARLDVAGPRIRASVFTPIGRDHLDWHGGEIEYREAKLRLARAVTTSGGFAIGHARCSAFARLRSHPCQHVTLGADSALPRVEGSHITLGEETLLRADELALRGHFNLENAALAIGTAMRLGVRSATAARAVTRVTALPHRMQEVGRRHGVLFVDNGVSTITETSRLALETYAATGPVHWVCGGKRKEPDLQPAADLASLATSTHLYGAVAAELGSLIRRQSSRPVTVHDRQVEALEAAWEQCRPGATLLSSPGFASHDQYPNFRARALEARAWWDALRCPPGAETLGSAES